MPLANYAEKYIHQIRSWLKPLFVEKQPELSQERFCLSISDHQIHVLRVLKNGSETRLISFETLKFDEMENIPLILSALISRTPLLHTPVLWLLAPDDYQLFLIESLPVEKNEFAAALKWRARNLVNYPIEEATIDSFKLPPKKTGLNSMIATVIAQKNRLQTIIATLQQSGTPLAIIDIPELAMRNLTALYENDEKSTAFIYFHNNLVILNISREKTLYFTRHIPLPLKSETNEPDYEQLSLDLLRYFDYYQSQWRHPVPNRIFVATNQNEPEALASTLTKYMLITITPFPIKDIIGDTAELLKIEKNNLLLLGCALREDIANATPGN